MLLRLLLLVVCSGIARGDNATNSTNGTYVGDDIDCTRYEDTPMVYMVASPLWLLLLIYWAYSIHVKHAQYANDMHRMLVWVPAVQAMQGALSIGYFNACPWESNVSMLLATLWVVITIIKDPVILFCLLMVAKGWCVTRAALSPNEVFSASVIASLMYISIISMYAMAMADANKVLSMMPTLVTYAVMLWHVMTAISFNLRILKAQLFALRRQAPRPLRSPALIPTSARGVNSSSTPQQVQRGRYYHACLHQV
jgi:hypothetical protein